MRRPPPLLEPLGARLRALREARGLTQEQVGERAGFSGKYVSEVERGLRNLPLSLLRAITQGLGASLEQVFAGLEVASTEAVHEAPPSYEAAPLPRNVAELSRALAALPPARRRRVVAVMRSMVALLEP